MSLDRRLVIRLGMTVAGGMLAAIGTWPDSVYAGQKSASSRPAQSVRIPSLAKAESGETLPLTPEQELENLKRSAVEAKDKPAPPADRNGQIQQELLEMAKKLGLSDNDVKDMLEANKRGNGSKPNGQTPEIPPPPEEPAVKAPLPPATQPAVPHVAETRPPASRPAISRRHGVGTPGSVVPVRPPTTQPVTPAVAEAKPPATQPATPAVAEPTPPATQPAVAEAMPPTTQPGRPSGATTKGPRTRMPEQADAKLAVISPDKTRNFWEIPPEKRLYSVNYQDESIKNVLADFSRYAQLPILNIEKAGDVKVTRRSKENMTFDELRAMVNEWLMPTSILVHRDYFMEVLPLSEIPRLVTKDHIYLTKKDFETAKVAEDIPVMVYYQPEKVSAAQLLDVFRSKAPDYMQIKQLADRNQMEIIAKAGDVTRFLDMCALGERMVGTVPVARQVREIKLEKSKAQPMADMLRGLVGTSPSVPRLQLPTKGPGRPATPEVDTRVEILPQEAKNTLIVQGTAERIAEVESLVKQLDPLGIGEDGQAGQPEVIPLEYASASDLANVFRQVVLTSRGSKIRMPVPQPPSKGGPISLPSLPGQVTIVPEPGTNSIILVGDEEQLKLIKPLVKLFDVPSKNEQKVERIALKHVEAATVQQALTPVMGGRKAVAPPALPPVIVAEPTGQAVFVRASQEDLDFIKPLIEQMDRPEDAAAQMQYKSFTLANVNPAEMLGILNAWKTPVATPGKPVKPIPVNIAPTPTGVFVSAPQKEMEQIAKLIADTDVPGQGQTPERFVLKNVPASAVHPILMQMLNRPAKGTQDRPPVVMPDPSGKAIVVVGIPPDIEKARQYIEKMDVADGAGMQFQTFPVQYANVAELLNVVRQMLVRPVAPGGQQPVIANTMSSLVVYASAADLEQVGKIVKELDVEGAGGLKEFIIRLEHVAPSMLANVINTMTASAATGRPDRAMQVRAFPDDSSMTLVLAAPETVYNDRIKPLIAEWDKPVAEGQMEQKHFVMKYASPQEIAATLTTMTQPRGPGMRAAGTVRIAGTSSGVLVQAPPAEMKRIEEMLAQLDAEQSVPTEIRTYPLEGTEVNGVAATLARLFADKQPRKGESAPVFIGDPVTGTMLVSAPTTMFERIETTIKTFQRNGLKQATAIRQIPVQFAAADVLVPVVQPILRAKMQELAAGSPTKMDPNALTVTPDPRTNRVVVVGPTAIIELAESLIKDLDQNVGESPKITRIVRLKKTSATEMVTALNAMLSGAVAPEAGKAIHNAPKPDSGGRVFITASPNTNALVLRGMEKDISEVEEWIKKIDEAAEGIGPLVKKYYIDFMSVDDLADQIMALLDTGGGVAAAPAPPKPAKGEGARGKEEESEEAYESTSKSGPRRGKDISIVTDYYASTMVVSAKPEKIVQINELIELLKTPVAGEPPPGPGEPYYLISLQHADPYDVTDKVDQAIGLIYASERVKPTVESVSFMDGIKVRGTPQQCEEIKGWVEQYFDKPSLSVSRKRVLQKTPPGMAEQLVRLLQANSAGEMSVQQLVPGQDLAKELEKVVPEVTAFAPIPTRIQVKPTSRPSPFVAPLTLQRVRRQLDSLVWAEAQATTRPAATQPATQPAPVVAAKPAATQPAPAPVVAAAPPATQPGTPAASPPSSQPAAPAVAAKPAASQPAPAPAVATAPPATQPTPAAAAAANPAATQPVAAAPASTQPVAPAVAAVPAASQPAPVAAAKPATTQPAPVVAAAPPASQPAPSVAAAPPATQPAPVAAAKPAATQPVPAPTIAAAPPATQPAPAAVVVAAPAASQPVPSPAVAAAPATSQPAPAVAARPAATQPTAVASAPPTATAAPPASQPTPAPAVAAVPPATQPAHGATKERTPEEKAWIQSVISTLAGTGKATSAPATPPDETVRIGFDDGTGRVVIDGPAGRVEELEDLIDVVMDEIDAIAEEEEIKVYHLTYVDVAFAAAVLERMFNAAAGPAGQAQAQPQQPGQMTPQQAAAARAAQAKQQGGEEKPKEEEAAEEPEARDRRGEQGGRREREGDEGADSGKSEVRRPGSSASSKGRRDRIRVMPDPRTRTVIVRAARADLPIIVELLAKLDKESPLPVEYRIFKLKNLKAAEAETMIKTLLGIERRGGRQQGTQQAMQQPQAAAQGRVPQAPVMPAMNVPEVGGLVNPSEQVTVTSDPITNSVIVLAPDAAMVVIDKLIQDLEKEEPERITLEIIQLKQADVSGLATTLGKLFRGGARGGKAEEGVDPTKFDDVQLSAEPRTNTLIIRAHTKDIEKIKPLVAQLDVKVTDEKVVDVYPVDTADVSTMAKALQETFGEPGKAEAEGAMAVRVIADTGTSSILVHAPKSMREQIKVTLDEMMAKAASRMTPKPIQLKVANANDVADTLMKAFGRGAGGKGRASVQITGDKASRTLMVIAPDEVFKEIKTFAEQLDQTVGVFDVKIFPLKNAKAAEVLEKFNQMVAQMMQQLNRVNKTADLDVFAASADPRTNSLVVMGGTTTFELVDRVLKQLDIPPLDAGVQIIKHFTMTKVAASATASAINTLFAGQDMMGAEPPKAVANDSTNSLVVYATQRQMEMIEKEVINKFETFVSPKEAASQLVEERIQIKNVNVEEIAQTVSAYFEKKFATLTQAGITNFKPIDKAMGFIPEISTKTLVVQASPANVEEIKKLVERYDVPDAGQLTARQMKIYAVQYATPNYVVSAINETFQSTGKVAEKDKVTATYEPGTQTIIVRASDTNLEKIEKLIKDLDVDRGTKRETFFHEVKAAKPSEIAPTLQQVVAQQPRSKAEALPTIQANDVNNTLIISCSKTEYDAMKPLLEKLDVKSPAETGRTLKIYSPEWISPSGFQTAIDQAFQSRAVRGARPEELVQSAVEPSTQVLMVTASVENHKRIEELLQQLDKEEAQAQVIEIIPLKQALPADVMTVLNTTLLSGRGRRPRITVPMAITPDPTHNALIFSGTKQDFQAVLALIAKLDREPQADTGRVIQIYPIRYTEPTYVNSAIQTLFKPSGKMTPEDQVTSTVDMATYSLVVSATAPIHQKIKDLIEKMDQEGEGKVNETVRLMNASPSAVIQMLTNVYTTTRRRTRSGEQPVNFIADPSHNSIVLTGPKREIEGARKLVEQFDVAPDQGAGRTVEVYPIRYTNPSYIQTVLQSMFTAPESRSAEDQVSITLDYTNYSLIVSATPRNHQKVVEIITKMDVESDTQKTTEVVELQHATPSDVIPMLQSVYSTTRKRTQIGEQPVNFIAHDTQNAIILTGSPREIFSAKELIARFDQLPKEGAGRTIKVYPVKYANPSYIQSAITALTTGVTRQAKKPEDTITTTIDYGNYALIVSATQKNHEKVQEIMTMMDIETAEEKTLESVKLKYAAPSDVISMLNSVYASTRKRKASGEQQVNFLSDPARNAIVLTGPKPEIETAKSLIEKFDLPPDEGAGRSVEIYPIEYANPSYVASAIQSVVTAGVTSQTKKPEDVVTVNIDYGSYSLIVSATPPNHKKVKDLIAKMDVEQAQAKAMDVVKLKHATPSDVIAMLTSVYSTTRKRLSSGEQQVNFVADPSRNAIVLTGLKKEIETAKGLINQFDTPPEEGAGRTVKIYPIEFTNPSYVQSAIQTLTTGVTGRQKTPEDMINVTMDYNNYALIVSATPGNHKKVEEIIKMMDVETVRADKAIEVVTLKNSSPTDTITMLNSVYSTTRKRLATGEPQVNFIPDPSRNAIVLTGPSKEIEKAKGLIEEFDLPPDEGTGRRIEIYPIEYVNPSTIASAIQTISQGVSGRGKKTEDVINVTPDYNSYSLIVSATPANHEKVVELITKMDVESAREKATKMVPVKNTVPSDVITMLTNVYSTTRKRKYSGEQPVNFIADPSHNQIVLTGSAKEIEEAEKLIAQFDLPPDEGSGRRIEIYPIEYTNPSYVQSAIQTLTAGVTGRQQKPEDIITVTIDYTNYSLIVSATPPNHKKVKDLIEKMDVESVQAKAIEIVRLKHTTPTDTISMLGNVYATTRKRKATGEQPVTFMADPSRNAIVLTGLAREIETAKALIEKFDTPPEEGTGRTIEVYTIEYANPSYIQSAVQSLVTSVSGRSKTPEDIINMTIDYGNYALLVSATPQNHQKVKEIIAKMDVETARPKDIEIVNLKHSTPTDTIAMLNSVYTTTRKRLASGEQQVNFVADASRNAIILTGSRKDIDAAKALIDKFDVPADEGVGRSVQIYPIEFANPSTVSSAIQSLTTPLTGRTRKPEDMINVTVDYNSYSLIVSATPPNHQKVKDLIALMDVETARPKTMEIVKVQHSVPSDVINMLSSVYTTQRKRANTGELPVNFLPDEARNAVILIGSAKEIEDARGLIEKFDTPAEEGTGRSVEIYPIEYNNPASVLQAIQTLTNIRSKKQSPEDIITASVDYANDALVVSATQANHRKIKRLIETMDRATAKQKATEVVKLEHATPSEVITMLTSVYSSTRRRKVTGEQYVNFIADPPRNSIVLVGPQKEIDGVKELIQTFDAPPDEGTGRRVEIYPIEYTNPSYVQTAIQSLTVGPTNRQLKPEDVITVNVDYTNYSLIVSATPENHKKVKELVEKMDVETAKPKGTEIVKLVNSTPTETVTMLTSVYSASRRRKATGEQQIAFVADPARNAIVLTGPQKEILEAKELIQKFDTPPDEGSGRRVEIYPVEYANPSTVSSAITSLTAGITPGQKKPEDVINVTVDYSNYSLIVSAIPRNHEKVKELLAKMDVESARQKDSKLISLKHAVPTDVIQMLTSVYSTTRKRMATGDQPVNFIADPAHNQIVLTGTTKEIEEAEALIKQFDTPPDEGMGRRIRIYPLQYTNPAYVQTAITSLSAGVTGRQKRPEDVIVANIDYSSYSLIVSATPENHKKVEEIIKMMDVESVRPKITEVVLLKNAAASDVITVLQSVYATSRKREIGGEQPVNFIADLSRNAVVLTGAGVEIERAKKLIEEFDVEPEQGAGRQVKVYPIQYTDLGSASQAIQNLTLSVTGRGQQKPEDIIKATIDAANSALIVSAVPKVHKQIVELLAEMDVESKQANLIETVRLEYATTTDVITMLQGVYTSTRRATRQGERPVTFIADPLHNAIVLTGKRVEIDQAKQLIAQFDKEPEEGTERTVETYPIRYTSASTILTAVQSLSKNQARTGPQRPEDEIRASVDPASNSLIVSATPKNHEKVVEIVLKMDTEGEGKATEMVVLKEAVPADVIRVLQNVYQTTRKRTATGDMPVTFTADERSNSVVLAGLPHEVVKAKELVAMLDVPPSGEFERTVQVYRVQYVNPQNIVTAITNAMRERTQTAPNERVSATADIATGVVIVYANAENHAKIKELIAQVDAEDQRPYAHEVFELRYARAGDVSQILNKMLASTRTVNVKGLLPLTITADENLNALIVTGPQKEFDDLKPIIAKLDVEPSTESELSFRVYTLKYADATNVSAAVRNAFPARTGTSLRDQVTVTAETGTNALIVRASGENHEKIDRMIQEIDVTGLGTKETYVVEIRNADPKDVSDALTEIFIGQRRPQIGGSKITITQPAGTKKVVITATEREYEEISAIIKDLDVASTTGTDMVVIPVRNISASDANKILQEYLRKPGSQGRPGELSGNVRIIPSEGTKSLLVTGEPKQLENIQGLLGKIDIEQPAAPPGEGRMTRIFQIQYASPQSVSTFITQTYRQTGDAPEVERVDSQFDTGTQSVIVTAKQSKIDEIAKTIQELDQETTRSDRTERIALKHAEAEDVAQTLVELYEDQQRGGRATGERPPSITADPGTNSILVYASQAQLDRIRPLIQELDTEQQADAPEIIRLEKATASEVLAVLTQVFAEQGRQRSTRRGGPQAEPVIQALDASNSLIVRARPRELGLIKTMVKTLDSETAVGLTSLKVIQLDEAVNVQEMAANIERLINEGEQNKTRATPGVKPNLVSIGADDRTNSLIVAGSTAQFGIVEQLAKKLEGMGPKGRKVIRIVPLRNIQSDEVKQLINQLIDEQQSGRSRSSRRRGFGPRSCLDRIPEIPAFRAA